MKGGVLGWVLVISRVVGVAPFIRGAEYRVSLPLAIFAKLFILIFAVDFILISASSSKLFLKKYETLLTLEIPVVITKIFTIITTFACVFTSPERIIRVLRSLKQLEQIDKKILRDLVQYPYDVKLTVLIFIYLHVCVCLRGYYLNTGKINETIINILFLITHYMINLTELQIGLFARRTMFSFKVMNSALEKLCKNSPITVSDVSSQMLKSRPKHSIVAWEKVKQQSGNITTTHGSSRLGRLVKTRVQNIEEPEKLIRQCLKNYLNLCDVVTASMDGDGLLIVILLMHNILLLLTHSYKLALGAVSLTSNFVKPNIYVAIFWGFANFLSLIIFMEPYHRTQSEMHKLQFLLISLKWANLDDIDINNELHLFERVVNINKPKYSPLGMFTLNRLLVVKIFGSLVTYLVILVTYGPRLDNINLTTAN